ncbi:MAG TPA: hypothetical protein VJ976_02085 [Ornithinimicrobium sp.]|uniref:hypothetical protein n=1 Tax=Ornithinimicrobium sp. TaxID=1977084 RepID=UPI002B493DF5|nr:hypothetical protein [Ornithinimicrobium sp.]HKJ11158.1 hypothetical protein [Ornithinimicrobium sp.]
MAIRNRPAWQSGHLLDAQTDAGERRARTGEVHVRDLSALSRRIENDIGAQVPLPDPAGGGRRASVLLLLEEHVPCRTAGTGILSLHANDPTAGHTLAACSDAELAVEELFFWAVIPWWTQDPALSASGRVASRARQAGHAGRWLGPLLSALPELNTVVLLGRSTSTRWEQALAGARAEVPAGLAVLRAPHTSPMTWNMTDRRTGRLNREVVHEVLCEARSTSSRPGHASPRGGHRTDTGERWTPVRPAAW